MGVRRVHRLYTIAAGASDLILKGGKALTYNIENVGAVAIYENDAENQSGTTTIINAGEQRGYGLMSMDDPYMMDVYAYNPDPSTAATVLITAIVKS